MSGENASGVALIMCVIGYWILARYKNMLYLVKVVYMIADIMGMEAIALTYEDWRG